jgi:hypothetical protein
VRECGGIVALVGLLAPACSAAVHRSAAGALACLTRESVPSCEAVEACGGAAALEGVLAGASSAVAHRCVADVLYDMGRIEKVVGEASQPKTSADVLQSSSGGNAGGSGS